MTTEHYNREHFSNSTLKFYFINFYKFVWNGNLTKTKKVFNITVSFITEFDCDEYVQCVSPI
jgi:hypothetical protein